VVAQSYLQDLLKLGSEAASGLPWLAALLSPDRWLLWLGVLFVLSVYYFPTGIVGKLRCEGRTMSDQQRHGTVPLSRYAQLAGREIHWHRNGARPMRRWSSPGTAWRAPAATWTNWRSTSPRAATA
jgi:hypothetical protein